MKVLLTDLKLGSRYDKLRALAGKEFSFIQDFVSKAKNGENSRGVDIADATESKYIDALTMAYKSVNKPLFKLSKDDLIILKHGLKDGKIKSRYDKPYSASSQREMELILIRFLEFANPKKYAGFRKWFIVKIPKKDVEFLREEEIEKLFRSAKSSEERFLLAVLFDSGARASEFLNIRSEDITLPTASFPYYKINLKEEYSKTKGRNIGLYWKHSTDAIRDFLKDRGEMNQKDVVFIKTYDAIRLFLTRMGKRILNKRLHFHIFRKSSATYYAQKLKSRQQLCYRYGWNFSSDVPDVYISRQQGEEEVKTEMLSTDLQKLDKENRELKTMMNISEEKIEVLESKHREVMEALEKEIERRKIMDPYLDQLIISQKLINKTKLVKT